MQRAEVWVKLGSPAGCSPNLTIKKSGPARSTAAYLSAQQKAPAVARALFGAVEAC